MQVPFTRLAVDPRERGIRQARHEVVALRVVAVPPARLDALRAGERRKFAFAQFFFFFQQPQRARSWRAKFARVPFARLDAAPGMLGAVIGLGGEAADRVVAKARAQPLGEARPAFGLGGAVAEHAGALSRERGEIPGFEPDRLHGL